MTVEAKDPHYLGQAGYQPAAFTAGANVAQVHVGHPGRLPLAMALKQLSGFERVELAAGESKPVSVRIPLRQFSHWSVEAKGWQLLPGGRTIFVGSSSRDLPNDS